LFQIEDRVLTELSTNSFRHPASHPQRVTLEELSKIPGNDEAVHAHIVAVLADSE
jgi:hypothetical protein